VTLGISLPTRCPRRSAGKTSDQAKENRKSIIISKEEVLASRYHCPMNAHPSHSSSLDGRIAFLKSPSTIHSMVRPLPRPPVISRESSAESSVVMIGRKDVLRTIREPLSKPLDSNSAFALMSPTGDSHSRYRLKMKCGPSLVQALRQDTTSYTETSLSDDTEDEEMLENNDGYATTSITCWQGIDRDIRVRSSDYEGSRTPTPPLTPTSCHDDDTFGEYTPRLTFDTSFESMDSPLMTTTPCTRQDEPLSPPPLLRVATDTSIEIDDENLPRDLFFPTF